MSSQFARLLMLALLFMGCVGLSVPAISQRFEAWLLGTQTGASPDQAQQSATESARQAVYQESAVPKQSPPPRSLDFGFEEPALPAKYPVKPSSLEQPVAPAREEATHESLVPWQQQLEQLGARYLIVEQLEMGYQCRCLIPVAEGSVYEKPFSAVASSPTAAMQQVIAQVKQWQSESAATRPVTGLR
jgi:hypothetical protein